MKKLKSLLILFVILLTVGCGEPKTELDKFKKYLTKSKDFRCVENICKIDDEINKNHTEKEMVVYRRAPKDWASGEVIVLVMKYGNT